MPTRFMILRHIHEASGEARAERAAIAERARRWCRHGHFADVMRASKPGFAHGRGRFASISPLVLLLIIIHEFTGFWDARARMLLKRAATGKKRAARRRAARRAR